VANRERGRILTDTRAAIEAEPWTRDFEATAGSDVAKQSAVDPVRKVFLIPRCDRRGHRDCPTVATRWTKAATISPRGLSGSGSMLGACSP